MANTPRVRLREMMLQTIEESLKLYTEWLNGHALAEHGIRVETEPAVRDFMKEMMTGEDPDQQDG